MTKYLILETVCNEMYVGEHVIDRSGFVGISNCAEILWRSLAVENNVFDKKELDFSFFIDEYADLREFSENFIVSRGTPSDELIENYKMH